MKDKHGNRQRYRPGDWFQCGKHVARKLIAEGSAEFANIRDQELTLQLSDCGIVLYGGEDEDIAKTASYYNLDIVKGEPQLAFSRTLIVEAGSPIRQQMIPMGYSRLELGWQLAIPVCRDDTLAEEIGTVEDRERTREVIRNLTVPVYDTRALFMARCSDTRELVDGWNAERGDGDDRLAFLRAYYVVKPVVVQLPAESWMG